MRVTRDTLLKLAKETVQKRFVPDRNVTAVFLVGSMRAENAFWGQAADIDLLIIYNGEPPREREILKLTNEIHLDLAFENSKHYAQPRDLRGDAWRGWALWDPTLLHEKGRFFEYTQAILRSQFDDPVNLLKRAYFFSAPARTAWTEMMLAPEDAEPLKYLSAVADAANAFAVLTGEPLSERRLFADFPARAQKLGNAELVKLLLGTLGGQMNVDFIRAALPTWEAAFIAAAQKPLDLRIHPARLAYYKSALETLLAGDFPLAAGWPLLFTWALAADSDNLSPEQAAAWAETRATLGLDSAGMESRLQALDALLDVLEETLEQTASKYGV